MFEINHFLNKNLQTCNNFNKMKTKSIIIFSLFYLLSGSLLFAQESITRNLNEFYSLDVMGNIRVEIYPSDQNRAELFLQNITPDKVITDINDLNLSIRLRTDTPKDTRITVKLYYNTLHKITVNSNAHVISDIPLKGEEVEFNAKSGGMIDLELELTSLTAKINKGASISFSGSVNKQHVKVSTGATYTAYTLEASDSYVKAISGGTAKVTASRIIDAKAIFKGIIGYKGSPVSTYIKTSFGGEISNYHDDRTE